MKRFITQFLSDESGATAIEYGLLASLIALAIIIGASLLGTTLNTLFKDIAACVDGVTSTDCKFD
jgi:pilus assembly protein Flp/PilA